MPVQQAPFARELEVGGKRYCVHPARKDILEAPHDFGLQRGGHLARTTGTARSRLRAAAASV